MSSAPLPRGRKRKGDRAIGLGRTQAPGRGSSKAWGDAFPEPRGKVLSLRAALRGWRTQDLSVQKWRGRFLLREVAGQKTRKGRQDEEDVHALWNREEIILKVMDLIRCFRL